MKIENNTNMQPNSQDCSINLQQDKFFNKLTDELKALQTQLFEVEKKVNARDTVIDTLDLSTQTLSVGESTETKDLYVNNNASIQGELSANKATIDTLTVLNDFITKLLHVTDLFANTADIEEADIRSAIIDVLKIKQAILRFDTNQEIVSFPSENVTQIGDIANSILLAGLERPTWNGDPIALTSDLSMGLTPNYKGTLNTETELPPTATVGDFYLIKELTRSGQTGLGGAIYGINKTWEVTLYYELLNYFNKDEINQLFDEELIDDIQRETDIIKGNTPVQVVANGCVMKRDDGTSDRLATAVDAFMLSGPEGMDNIARNSSLDDLVICGQYSADDDLANTITEKPNGEVGAFDIAVGQFSGSKQDIYQLYTGKASQKNYFRIGLNKEFNGWNEIAYANGETPVEIAKRLFTHGAIDSFNLPNNYGNKIVTYSGNAVDSPAPTSNGQAMTFSKGGSEQAIIAFDNSKNDMYFKTQFGTWNEWKKTASLDENGYVEKAKVADNLNANAKLDGKEIATTSNTLSVSAKTGVTILNENYDLNTLITPGRYYCSHIAGFIDITGGLAPSAYNINIDVIGRKDATGIDITPLQIITWGGGYLSILYRRLTKDKTWTAYQVVGTNSNTLAFDLQSQQRIGYNVNFDDFKTPGVMLCGYSNYQTATNVPNKAWGGGTLLVFKDYYEGDFITQIFIGYRTDLNIAIRKFYKTWSKWGVITTTQTLNTQMTTYNAGITKETK